MSDKKLYQVTAMTPGASDLVYISRADGSADGSTSFTGLTSVLTGILTSQFAASSHTHTLSQITDAGSLATYAAITPSANVVTILGAANYAAIRTDLGLVIGTNVQAYSANLTTFAGIAPSANVQTLLGAADYSAFRTSLGLVIGTNVQAYSANLTTYAGIAPSANVQTLLGAASFSAFRTSLSLVPGTDVQTYSASLAALAALSTTGKIYYLSAANTWTAVTIGGNMTFSAGTLDAVAGGTGTVTASGSPTSGYIAKWTSGTDITKGDLSGDISTSGSLVTTIGSLKVATGMIQASAVTLAKIANAAANSKLVGSGASGSGSAYAEITLGTGLSMSGTTLSATASSNTSSYTGSGATIYLAGNLTATLSGNATILFDTSLYNDTVDPGDGGGVQRLWLGANKTAAVASTVSDTLTITAHGLTTGEGPFFFTTTTTLPGGMSAATKYWAIVVDANTISIATSRTNALATTKVDITSSGTGTHTLNTGPFLVAPKGVARMQFTSQLADTGTAVALNVLILKNGATAIGMPRQDTETPNTQGGNAAGAMIPVSEGDYFEMQYNAFSADSIAAAGTWFSCLVWK